MSLISAPSQPVQTRTPILALLLAITLLAAWPAQVFAQGTSGTLPDPISTRELMSYTQRLKLSPEQLRAAEAAHDQYKKEFRTLREGEIASFMRDMRKIQGVMPKRSDMETFMKKMEQLTARIAAVDNRLFDAMQTSLTDDQLAIMPRVRQARQRARYRAQDMLSMTGRRVVDLSELLLDPSLRFDAQQALILDGILAPYESRLTTLQAKLFEATTGMISSMFEAMESMGFNEEMMNDPEAMEKFGKAMQEVYRDITRKSFDLAAEMSELNNRTFRSMAAAIGPSEPAARALRDRYYSQAYPEASFALQSHEAAFEKALRDHELTDQQREVLTAVNDEMRRKLDRILDEVLTLADKSSRETSPFDYDMEKLQQQQKALSELQVRAEEARAHARQVLEETLGRELAQTILRTAVAADAGGNEAAAAVPPRAPEVDEDDDDDVKADAQPHDADFGDQFVPHAISQADLNNYMKRLETTDEQRPLMQAVFRSYEEQIHKIRQTHIGPLTRATQRMWNFDEATHITTPPTSESIEEVHRLRQAAIDAIRSADAAFFDDVELAGVEPPQLPKLKFVRLARERQIYNRSSGAGYYPWGGSWMGGSQESAIDLSALVQQQRWPAELASQPQIASALEAYEESVARLFRERFEVALESVRLQDRFNAEMIKAHNEGNAISAGMRYQEVIGEASRKVAQANGTINELNRSTLNTLVQHLPGDQAHKLRDAYNRRAFPNVYNDPHSLDRHIDLALNLPQITAEQRSRLSELALEYRAAYGEFSEQMVKLSENSDAAAIPMGFDAEATRKFMDRQDGMAKLTFDRNELSARAASTLRSILGEDLIKAIGGLPEPAKQQDWFEFEASD